MRSGLQGTSGSPGLSATDPAPDQRSNPPHSSTLPFPVALIIRVALTGVDLLATAALGVSPGHVHVDASSVKAWLAALT
jgi:hypothetical protein